jgi:hypothetical protein
MEEHYPRIESRYGVRRNLWQAALQEIIGRESFLKRLD